MADGKNAGGSHHGEISAAHLPARGSGADLTVTPLRVPDETNEINCFDESWIDLDGLWEIAKQLIPAQRVRAQGGGTQGTPDATLFATVVYLWSGAGTGCSSASTYRSRSRRLTADS